MFCGPTIPASAVLQILPSATIRPPAACGDIYRVCRRDPPATIGLIDGYFDHRLSVWHKEILWALDQGFCVYGSASMGALRAAELSEFGMRGVGRVFEQFRTGELEDDDEVAVIHESAERGYAPQSDAMVNLRETLRHAADAGVIGADNRARLLSELKGLFYPQRTRQALIQLVRSLANEDEKQGFLDWIATRGIVDQKQLDALEMLKLMTEDVRAGLLRAPPVGPARRFEYTSAWHALRDTVEREERRTVGSSPPLEPSSGPVPWERDGDASTLLARVRDEMKESYDSILLEAVERGFALMLSELDGVELEPRVVQSESERFREARGLMTPEQTSSWLAQNGMNVADFSALIYDNALSDRFVDEVRRRALQQLQSVLRNRGVAF